MGLVVVEMVWGGDGGGLGLRERGHGGKCQAHGGKNNLNRASDSAPMKKLCTILKTLYIAILPLGRGRGVAAIW